MGQDRILGGDLRRIHFPLPGRGGDQHRFGAGASLTQLVPGARDRGRTSRALIAIDLGIDVRLLHHDMVPVGVEFLGNDHAERGLDALADLRAFGIDGNRVVRGDADEGVHHLVLAVRRLGRERSVSEVEAQHQPRGAGAGQFEEATPPHRRRRIGRRYGADLADQRREISIGPGKVGLACQPLGASWELGCWAACFRRSATSLAVKCAPLAPKRAVT